MSAGADAWRVALARKGLIVTLVVLIVAAAGGWWWWRGHQGPPAPVPAELATMDADLAALVQRAVDAVDARRGDADRRMHLGLVYEANGMWGYAGACYEQVVAARPDDVRAWYHLGHMRTYEGDFVGSVAALRAAVDAEPDFVPGITQLGFIALDDGDPAAAAARFARALELDSAHEPAAIGLVLVHLARGDADAAADRLDDDLLDGRFGAYAHRLLARVHRRRGETDAVDAALAQAGGLRPDWVDPWRSELASLRRGTKQGMMRASALLRSGQPAAALIELEAVRDADPRNVSVLNQLAACQRELGQFDAALATLDTALAIDPDRFWTHLARADTLWAKSRTGPADLEAALRHADAALRAQPGSASALRTKGRILIGLQRHAEAVDVLWLAHEADPRDPSVPTQAGFLALDLQRWDDAARAFEAALVHETESATPLVGLAAARIGQDRLDDATAVLEQAARRRVDRPGQLERVRAMLAARRRAAGP